MTMFMRPEEIEREFGINRKTLANWRLMGKGPKARRVSRKMVLYRRADIEEWLSSRPTAGEGTGEVRP